jgi:hypothetical protein
MQTDQSSFERVQSLRAVPTRESPGFRPVIASLDDDETTSTAATTDDAADENDAAPRGGLLRPAGFILGIAVLGVVLAFAWRSGGARVLEAVRAFPAFASQPAPKVAAVDPTAEQFARIARELEALKATIGQLSAAQQQTFASIAALQAGQQQLTTSLQELERQSTPAAPLAPVAATPPAPRAAAAPQTPRPATPPRRPTPTSAQAARPAATSAAPNPNQPNQPAPPVRP